MDAFPQWEYLVLDISNTDSLGSDSKYAELFNLNNELYIRENPPESIDTYLNLLGYFGWELSESMLSVLVFKRLMITERSKNEQFAITAMANNLIVQKQKSDSEYEQKIIESGVIKIGWFGALTGDQALWGENEFNTVKMLFDEYNASGGIQVGNKKYKLEVIGYDNKGDAQEAVTVVKWLTGQDKVVAILGPNASGNAIPIAPVLEKAKVPDIATVATNPKVTVLDGKVKPYNFRVCFIDPYQGAVAAGYAFNKLGARKAAILYDVSDDYSLGLRNLFMENFTKLGGEIVADESFNWGDTDFITQLINIKVANPDIIFMPYFFMEVALSANQARELGINQVMIGGDGWPSEQLISIAGKAVEGSYIINHIDYADPDVTYYKARYLAKFGIESELNGYLVHDAVLLLVAGLKKAGKPNGEALAKALEGIEVQGITGKIKISPETHNPEGKDAAILKIVDGQYVFQEKYGLAKEAIPTLPKSDNIIEPWVPIARDMPLAFEKSITIKKAEKGNSVETTLGGAQGTVGHNIYSPVYYNLPLPKTVSTSIYNAIPDLVLPPNQIIYTAQARRRAFISYYEFDGTAYRLKVDEPLDQREPLWQILEDAGYDAANADYKQGRTLLPVVIGFIITRESHLKNIEILQSSGDEVIDKSVLYGFKRAAFWNKTGETVPGKFTYRF